MQKAEGNEKEEGVGPADPLHAVCAGQEIKVIGVKIN